jgi:hypothetical protein
MRLTTCCISYLSPVNLTLDVSLAMVSPPAPFLWASGTKEERGVGAAHFEFKKTAESMSCLRLQIVTNRLSLLRKLKLRQQERRIFFL